MQQAATDDSIACRVWQATPVGKSSHAV